MALLAYLAVGFKLWMIVDAMRRRVHLLWWLLLMLPFGDWIYFFTIKLGDFNVRPGPPPQTQNEPSLDDLRQLERESPSFDHRARLASALAAAGLHSEACEFFEKCLHTHPRDRDVRYGLGLARLDAGDRAGGIEALSQLVDQQFAYDDYGAASRLAAALFDDGRTDEALAAFEEIARRSHKLEHDVVLARCQLRAERVDDARATLEHALQRFEAQPDDVRPRSGAVATEARRLLRTLDSEAG